MQSFGDEVDETVGRARCGSVHGGFERVNAVDRELLGLDIGTHVAAILRGANGLREQRRHIGAVALVLIALMDQSV
jgi:hypothetical protein